MTNEEMMLQIAVLFEQQATKFDTKLEQLDAKFNQKLELMRNEYREMLEAHTTRIELKMENEITRKIDALYDGYKLTQEKLEALTYRVEELEIKVG